MVQPLSDEAFSMRGARSVAIISVVAMVLILETGVLHIVLAARHPMIAWALTASSVSIVLWLTADQLSLGRCTVRVTGDQLVASIGRRVELKVPLSLVAAVTQPRWSDLPRGRAGYLNATKPATPNVLVAFLEPVNVRLFGMRRPIASLGVHLDQPARFVEVLENALTIRRTG
jgi:hypothetical protein